MSLRVYIGLVLAGMFLLSLAFIGVSAAFLDMQLATLLPSVIEGGAVRTLFLAISGLSILFTLAMLLLQSWFLGRFVTRPLQEIVAAMQHLADTGQRTELSTYDGAPSEIRSLGTAFVNFADKVDEGHKRDLEISRVKSDFISTAAHQLRTPLTGIRWALEALQLEALTDAQKTLVVNATEKSHQLVAVVGTLLDISAIESGKYKYVFVTVDVAALLSEIARDFEPLATKAQVALFYEKSATEVMPVRADRERIRWVLNNLIENAIRYTPAGGTVRLTAESATGRTYIRVEDSGIGIAPEDQGNIFERFYRAPNAIAKENGGNGLGLYIARTIATDHGGDLNFRANEGSPGTTFTLSLPLA